MGQEIDPTFVSPRFQKAVDVLTLSALDGGRVAIFGNIDYYDDNRIGRSLVVLNSAGEMDAVNTNLPEAARNIERQSNGNYILEYYSTVVIHGPGGEFIAGLPWDYQPEITAIAVQPDDRILVAEWLNGDVALRRFTATGAVDASFPEVILNDWVTDIVIHEDKILIAGIFSTVNNTTANSLVRLNLDGSIDATFNAGSGTLDFIGQVAVQPDGKILLADSYINGFNGEARQGLIRLNADGSVDTGFDLAVNLTRKVSKASFIGDKILLNVTDADGSRIALFNQDGSVDTSFPAIPAQATSDFVISGDGIVVVNNDIPGVPFGIARYSLTGSRVTSYAPRLGSHGAIAVVRYIGDVGKIVAAGDFCKVNDDFINKAVVLNADGSIDASFQLGQDIGDILDLKVVDDQFILAAGEKGFIRMTSDGSIDGSFDYDETSLFGYVTKFVLQPDGKIIAFGFDNFTRLNADGSRDVTFDFNGEGPNGTYFDVGIQSNGKLIYGGVAGDFQNLAPTRLIRFTPDGSHDATFDAGYGPDSDIGIVTVFPEDEVVLAGPFAYFDSVAVNGIVKLSADGVVNQEFVTNISALPVASPSFAVPYKNKMFLATHQEPFLLVNSNGTLFRDLSNVADIEFASIRSIETNHFDEVFVSGAMYQPGGKILSIVKLKLDPLEIEGVDNLITSEDVPLDIVTSNFEFISDSDEDLSELTLSILPGEHYTVVATTVVPDANFNGILNVSATVSNGTVTSPVFHFTITVLPVNDPPVMASTAFYEINEDSSFELSKELLQVSDLDHSIGQLSLVVTAGQYYAIDNSRIIPQPDFNGALTVNVYVTDGSLTSASSTVTINVLPVNDVPVVADANLSTTEDIAYSIDLTALQISDVDNLRNTLTVNLPASGDHFTIVNNTIHPEPNYSGPLYITFTASDGIATSAPGLITVNVMPVNDPPTISNAIAINTFEDEVLTLTPAMLGVSDPDHSLTSLSFIFSDSELFDVSGLMLTPGENFNGVVNLTLKVSDGTSESQLANIVWTIAPVNDAPVITGVIDIQEILPAEPFQFDLTNVSVTDPDNTYPTDFSFSFGESDEYRIVNGKLIVDLGHRRMINVTIVVSDGVASSAPFTFEVPVRLITGIVEQDVSLQIFPNPVHDVVTIELGGKVDSIELLDLQGRTVAVLPSAHKLHADLSNFASGLYFLIVKRGGSVGRYRIIKQ